MLFPRVVQPEKYWVSGCCLDMPYSIVSDDADLTRVRGIGTPGRKFGPLAVDSGFEGQYKTGNCIILLFPLVTLVCWFCYLLRGLRMKDKKQFERRGIYSIISSISSVMFCWYGAVWRLLRGPRAKASFESKRQGQEDGLAEPFLGFSCFFLGPKSVLPVMIVMAGGHATTGIKTTYFVMQMFDQVLTANHDLGFTWFTWVWINTY